MPPNKVPKMLQFLRDNRRDPQALTVRQEGDEATIYLYDVIDAYWGIGAETIAKALADLTAKTVHLRINSPGGDVFEARAIVTAIRGYQGKVVAHIDGVAASAASYIALAAAEVEMVQGAFFMIHKAWTLGFGNADELRATADLLDKVDGSIVHDYQAKTGKDVATIESWMAAETWFTADEAKAEGFVDRVVDPVATDNADKADGKKAAAQWNFGAYEHAPAALLAPPTPPAPQEDLLRANAERRLRLLDAVSA